MCDVAEKIIDIIKSLLSWVIYIAINLFVLDYANLMSNDLSTKESKDEKKLYPDVIPDPEYKRMESLAAVIKVSNNNENSMIGSNDGDYSDTDDDYSSLIMTAVSRLKSQARSLVTTVGRTVDRHIIKNPFVRRNTRRLVLRMRTHLAGIGESGIDRTTFYTVVALAWCQLVWFRITGDASSSTHSIVTGLILAPILNLLMAIVSAIVAGIYMRIHDNNTNNNDNSNNVQPMMQMGNDGSWPSGGVIGAGFNPVVMDTDQLPTTPYMPRLARVTVDPDPSSTDSTAFPTTIESYKRPDNRWSTSSLLIIPSISIKSVGRTSSVVTIFDLYTGEIHGNEIVCPKVFLPPKNFYFHEPTQSILYTDSTSNVIGGASRSSCKMYDLNRPHEQPKQITVTLCGDLTFGSYTSDFVAAGTYWIAMNMSSNRWNRENRLIAIQSLRNVDECVILNIAGDVSFTTLAADDDTLVMVHLCRNGCLVQTISVKTLFSGNDDISNVRPSTDTTIIDGIVIVPSESTPTHRMRVFDVFRSDHHVKKQNDQKRDGEVITISKTRYIHPAITDTRIYQSSVTGVLYGWSKHWQQLFRSTRPMVSSSKKSLDNPSLSSLSTSSSSCDTRNDPHSTSNTVINMENCTKLFDNDVPLTIRNTIYDDNDSIRDNYYNNRNPATIIMDNVEISVSSHGYADWVNFYIGEFGDERSQTYHSYEIGTPHTPILTAQQSMHYRQGLRDRATTVMYETDANFPTVVCHIVLSYVI